jgi:hypothetical protein
MKASQIFGGQDIASIETDAGKLDVSGVVGDVDRQGSGILINWRDGGVTLVPAEAKVILK